MSPVYPPEHVQYTIYRPRELPVEQWHPLLVFAHLSERRADDPDSEPEPLKRLEKAAKEILGDNVANYQPLTSEGNVPIPREGEITLVPEVSGVEFNPRQHQFIWEESVHRAEFRIRARAVSAGKSLSGRMTVYCGAIVVAEIALRFQVVATASRPVQVDGAAPITPYRKIFASYSRLDLPIVRQFENYAAAMGDRYLRDLVDIRAGQVWQKRLEEMIEEAQVFQLFWSCHSMRSEFVTMEWQHAMALNRNQFVRPTYWDDPFPESPDEGLPPEPLSRLHFVRIGFDPVKTDRDEIKVPAVSESVPSSEDDSFWLGQPRVRRGKPPPPPARLATQAAQNSDSGQREEPIRYACASAPRSHFILLVAAMLILLGGVLAFVVWKLKRPGADAAPVNAPESSRAH